MSKKNKKNRSKNFDSYITDFEAFEDGATAGQQSENEIFSENLFSLKALSVYFKSHFWALSIICFLALGAVGSVLKYLDDDARSELTKRQNRVDLQDGNERSFINKINPFLPALTPTPTPALSKEYIYAGSRLLAVEDSNANAALPADLAIWRPSNGQWWVMGNAYSQQATQQWGMSGDVPVAGDYDGDGKTDFAIWRPVPPGNTSPEWWVLRSSDNSYFMANLGSNGDIPVVADYDGDGKTDLATYTPASGMWWIFLSGTSQYSTPQFGLSGDVPRPADYDGDGRADVAVWRNSTNTFYSLNSSNNQVQSPTLGVSGDRAVSADYDGDGRADYAVYNSSTANWYVRQSTNGQTITYQWGASGDLPVPNDYDGDGKADLAVWRNSNGNWYISKSGASGALLQVAWGATGDVPVPAFYRR